MVDTCEARIEGKKHISTGEISFFSPFSCSTLSVKAEKAYKCLSPTTHNV